jgi:DNA-directed RNA polymerase subunit RPC12/RpoP
MYADERGTYRCDACGKEFDSEEALRAHVRSVGLID